MTKEQNTQINDQQYLASILPKLQEPMQYKWRVQSFSEHKPQATCVAYIDARDAMQRLDEVCVHGWHRRHSEVCGNNYCDVGIVMPSGVVLWRGDCGVESKADAEKGESSDAFKRACVNWGIGRFLYKLGMKYVKANAKKAKGVWPKVVNNQGGIIYNLSEFINGGGAGAIKNDPPKEKPKKKIDVSASEAWAKDNFDLLVFADLDETWLLHIEQAKTGNEESGAMLREIYKKAMAGQEAFQSQKAMQETEGDADPTINESDIPA